MRIVAAALVLIAISWLAIGRLTHAQLLAVATASMQPTFAPGDALVLLPMQAEQIQIGTVVSYHSPRNPNELVTHRVVGLTAQSLQTQGDALTVPDPPIRNNLVAGRVVLVLPGMGRVLQWTKTWAGLALTVYAPAVAVAGSELYRLEHTFFAKHPYRLHKTQMV
jgi:signal peptidase